MGRQYAISFSDRMSTYGVAKSQSNYYIEVATGIINVECEKGARYIDTIYVDERPAIFIFEK